MTAPCEPRSGSTAPIAAATRARGSSLGRIRPPREHLLRPGRSAALPWRPMEPDRTHSEPSAWQAAIDFGVDVTLLAANLERTPAERLRELVAMNRFQAELQARTVPSELRRRIDAEELMAKFGALLAAAPESVGP
jgi:hypothetical protein